LLENNKGVRRLAPLFMNSLFSRFRLLPELAFAACAKRAYTGAVRTAWKKIRYRLEWLGLKFATKLVPLLSRKDCYRLARKGAIMHLYGALRRGERIALLVDLTISAKLPAVAINCFGLERCVTFAHV
jgi:hypothetical protein